MAQRRTRTVGRQHKAVVRNERLTALTGGVLLLGFLVDLLVTANLSKLIMIHIFIGTLLAGPLLVKLTSVGYRFFNYYGGSPAFVAKGTPNIWLRLLGPALIIMTFTLFISGLMLAFEGRPDNRLVFLIHAGSAAVWVPLITVHVYAHIRLVPRSIASDWRSRSPEVMAGRIKRLRINIIALMAGVVAAIAMIPIAAPWQQVHLPPVFPSPLALGLVAAVIGVIIAIPLLRGARD